MNTTYYLILDTIPGKREKEENRIRDYLFQDGRWVPDTERAIKDRLMGYDPCEPPDSPYGIGNPEIMREIKTISGADAMRLIQKQAAGNRKQPCIVK